MANIWGTDLVNTWQQDFIPGIRARETSFEVTSALETSFTLPWAVAAQSVVAVYHNGLRLLPDDGEVEKDYYISSGTVNLRISVADGDKLYIVMNQLDTEVSTEMLDYVASKGSVIQYLYDNFDNLLSIYNQLNLVQLRHEVVASDPSFTEFTITNLTDAANIVTVNGVWQDPQTAYSITGSTLTFTESLLVGDIINIFTSATVVAPADWTNVNELLSEINGLPAGSDTFVGYVNSRLAEELLGVDLESRVFSRRNILLSAPQTIFNLSTLGFGYLTSENAYNLKVIVNGIVQTPYDALIDSSAHAYTIYESDSVWYLEFEEELLAGDIIQIFDDAVGHRYVGVPAASTSSGTKGQYAVDSSYLYICTATDSWKRITLETF